MIWDSVILALARHMAMQVEAAIKSQSGMKYSSYYTYYKFMLPI